MGNLHTDHGVNQVSELVREWNGSFSLPLWLALKTRNNLSTDQM